MDATHKHAIPIAEPADWQTLQHSGLVVDIEPGDGKRASHSIE
jgi:hypothetical protein